MASEVETTMETNHAPDEAGSSGGRDTKNNTTEQSLEDGASFLSSWTLQYLDPLLSLGAKKILENVDCGVPSKQDLADPTFNAAKKRWVEECERAKHWNETNTHAKKKKKPSLSRALIGAFGPGKFCVAMIYYLLGALLQFIPVFLLEDLVKFFEAGGTVELYPDGYAHPWVEVVGLFIFPAVITLFQTRNQVIMCHCATFVRTATSTLVYEKSLTVSATGRASTSTGQVVNLMANDTNQLQRFLMFIGMTTVAPLQIIISLILIFNQVGNATWVGVGFMVFLIPINLVIFRLVGKYRRETLKFSDLRVKMMNEILVGIRILKYYAWERPFSDEVGKLRHEEMKALTKMAYISAIGFSMILLSAPIIQPILVFLTYVNIQDQPLTASTAFTTVALFNIMRFPFAFMPMGLLQYIQSKISVRRLENYLELPELKPYVKKSSPSLKTDTEDNEEGSITIRNGSFGWIDEEAEALINARAPKKANGKKKKNKKHKEDSNMDKSEAERMKRVESYNSLDSIGDETKSTDTHNTSRNTLRNISCHIPAGSLVAVVGSVGCGKSSFLSALLGEMEAFENSEVYIPRTAVKKDQSYFMSYCTQSPWVINDTLRGNIVFGREFDEKRYNELLVACALVDDLAVLPAGDMTEIGERGINLSGGQKARVCLARAMYASSVKILLLDDPLSAVDGHVGEHLFTRAICDTENLMKDTTRILVTHHVHFLPRCDYVLMLEDGELKKFGTFENLLSDGVDFKGAIESGKDEDTTKGDKLDDIQNNVDIMSSEKKFLIEEEEEEKKEDIEGTTTDAEASPKVKQGEKLITAEEREEGEVSSGAYLKYGKAGGIFYVIGIFVIQGLGRAAEIMSAFWLAHWANQAMNAARDGSPHGSSDTTFYINIYAVFGMSGVFGLTMRSLFMAWHRLHASKRMHNDLTSSILRAPVSFFDVTPTGRILNRFSKDMDTVDLQLTQSLGQGVSTTFSVLGAFGAIVAATKGGFLAPLLPLSVLYYYIQKWFRRTSTELQRVTSINNSPIFSDFSSTLSGTSTIRAYDDQGRFFQNCKGSFDTHNASYVLTQTTNYWLGIRLDILGGLICSFIGALAVGTASKQFIPAGWFGLALSYSIEVTQFLKFGVRMIATIEAEMNSVERILYYTENVKPEAPATIPEDPSKGTWPTKGEINVEHASMRYRDGPLVLKDLTFKIEGGEKVGVVGRTGSGKSSLMNLLFRIVELEDDVGAIYIDGVNTGKIGTETLRLNLSIIPQDPVLFSNTVRYNIDPFLQSSDSEIWDVLEKVQLATVVAGLTKGLYELVAEGGENFSQGQRQLICIARSLLRKPKILVMDEATASIDNETDATIQKMIRENFVNATVLTIAHRLNTIMDSDRILVLDDGRISEYDSPENLLAKDNGIFKSMVEKQSRASHN